MALAFALTACKVKNYTPEIPAEFTQRATVASGDFSFECEICRSEKNVAVTVLSTSAKGMVMSYDGAKLGFKYNDFAYALDGRNFEQGNICIVIYDIMKALDTDAYRARKIDGGYRYEGSVDYGNFILIQNDDGSFADIAFSNRDYTVIFDV